MNKRPNGDEYKDEDEEYTSGGSDYDHGRADYRSLLPAEKQEHVKELWRICYLKASGAANIIMVFSHLHEKMIMFGSTRNLNNNLEDLERMIIEKKPKIVLVQNHPFKRFWNVLMILLLFYVATYVPFNICFGKVELPDGNA